MTPITVIITGPSGTGKTTLSKEFEKAGFRVLKSYTTRKPRENETDYNFITTDEFIQYIKTGFFIEYEEVYPGIWYGTSKEDLNQIKKENIVLVKDVNGAKKLKNCLMDNQIASYLIYLKVNEENLPELFARILLRDGKIEKSRVEKLSEENSRNDLGQNLVIDVLSFDSPSQLGEYCIQQIIW